MPKGMERTLVILKPDAVQRHLIGQIIKRFEQKGLKLVGIKMSHLEDHHLEKHYHHHKERPFFPKLVEFMRSAPSILMVWQGLEAIETVRILCGTTKARAAEAGSIRGDFGMSMQLNLVHASDSPENAKKEIALFFPDEKELFDWDRLISDLIYNDEEQEQK